jgi:23S rRNA pseudouridine2605 synthase
MMVKERVHKVIAARGYTSRRKAEVLIKEGKVFVNGERVTDVGMTIDPKADVVVEGQHLQSVEKVTYVFYKPTGAVSTTQDEHGRTTVIDFIRDDRRLYPVGRLDYDTSGLLLLTNDGELANRLLHPKHKIEKEYVVTFEGFLRKETSAKLRRGIVLDGEKFQGAKIFDVRSNTKTKRTTAHVIITEGKNHQIRRMFEAFGHPVIRLKRIRLGHLTLEGLAKGQYRTLTPHEYKELYVKTQLSS